MPRQFSKKIYVVTGFIITLVLGLGVFAFSTTVLANTASDTFGVATVDNNVQLGSQDIRVTIAKIINVVLGLLGVIAVALIIYGGITYMTAGGNEEKIGKAKKIIINSVIGLAIILSAVAITTFVLKKLQEATGSGNPPPPNVPCDPAHPETCDECQENPPPTICQDLAFYVKSITPSTPGTSATNMNNITVRVLFSHRLREGTDPARAVRVYNTAGNQLVPVQAAFSSEHGRYVVELKAVGSTGDIIPFPQGTYRVMVDEGVRDEQNKALDISYRYGGHIYLAQAEFSVGQEFTDNRDPEISPLVLNGKISNVSVQMGDRVTLTSVIRDYIASYAHGGVSLGYVFIASENNPNSPIGNYHYLTGPYIGNGSGVDFSLSYSFNVYDSQFDRGNYVATVVAYDVDGNEYRRSLTFEIVEPGGNDGDYCNEDPEQGAIEMCSWWLRCRDNRCVKWPVITDIDPDNAAPGSWVTILGRNLGDAQGQVFFGYDSNGDGSYDQETATTLAQCRENDVWHDDWIIAEVPDVGDDIVMGRQDAYARFVDANIKPINILDPDGVLSHINNNLSVEAAIKVAVNNRRTIVHKQDNYLLYQTGGNLIWFLTNADGTGPYISASLASYDGQWVHVVGVSEGNTARLYVNGNVVGNADYPGELARNGQGVEIGGFTDQNAGVDAIEVNDVAIYNRTLSQTEIQNHSNLWFGNTLDKKNEYEDIVKSQAIGYWPFTTTTDGQLKDESTLSPNPHHGAIAPDNAPVFAYIFLEDNTLDDIFSYIKVAPHDDRGYTDYYDISNDKFGAVLGPNDTYRRSEDGVPGLFTINDIERPGLCSVRFAPTEAQRAEFPGLTPGALSAPPEAPIEAIGKSFGASQESNQLRLGNQQSIVRNWSQEVIGATIPSFLGAGPLRVSVFVGSQSSNSVPFRILSKDYQQFVPVILDVDPDETTRGSLITIKGNNFGEEKGIVRIKTSRNGEGIPIVVDLHEECADTWTDNEVVVQLTRFGSDELITTGEYFVELMSASGQSSGLSATSDEKIKIVEGVVRPGICQLYVCDASQHCHVHDPQVGDPAPLPTAWHLRMFGVGLLEGASGEESVLADYAYFWKNGAIDTNKSTWLSSPVGLVDSDEESITDGDGWGFVETTIPADGQTASSIATGPVAVGVPDGVNRRYSNYRTYKVADNCMSAGTIPGMHCCTEGEDAGRWKPMNYACTGQERDAGYVWRFTTGKIIDPFKVRESCGVPSPSPWENWASGNNSCVNAVISVGFTAPLSFESVITLAADETLVPGERYDLSNRVRIMQCGTGVDPASSCTDVSADFDVKLQGDRKIKIQKKNNPGSLANFDSNTWYRVELGNSIESHNYTSVLGQDVPQTLKIDSSHSCGGNSAYCFEFKTGTRMCQLVGAHIEPGNYITRMLGILQNPSYPVLDDLALIFTAAPPLHPYYYSVIGEADQACTELDVSSYDWAWSSENATQATATRLPVDNSMAHITAWQNTAPDDVDIQARADIPTGGSPAFRTFAPTSTLMIDLGDPKVIEWWPNCNDACLNSGIGVRFNRKMRTDTYAGGLVVYKCTDGETCASSVRQVIQTYLASNNNDTILRAFPVSHLSTSTWYYVEIMNSILSIGGYEADGTVRSGNPVEPFAWKFRTQDNNNLCDIDHVSIDPLAVSTTYIGQKTLYGAIPVGAPGHCSAYGDELNPLDYGWSWNVADPGVASISQYLFSGKLNPTCSLSCLPLGSTVRRSVYEERGNVYPLCGNRIVDPGEDCDIAIGTESLHSENIPGSCTSQCLRPGSRYTSANPAPDGGFCGDGTVQFELGEECDPARVVNGIAVGRYCSATCTNKGSEQSQGSSGTGEQPDVNAPRCGSGSVSAGEDCDTPGQNGCSQNCVHTGTQIAQRWCDEEHLIGTEVCRSAISVCGNGIIESGESCEIGVGGASATTCSDQCLLRVNEANRDAICNNASLKQCNRGDEGCTVYCTFDGSSLSYSSPSFCGDGRLGVGEYRTYGVTNDAGGRYSYAQGLACEVSAQESDRLLGQNPVQMATALGESPNFDEDSQSFHTQISARAVSTTFGGDNFEEVSGSGSYALKCGYTEFRSREEQEAPTSAMEFITNDDVFVFTKNTSDTYILDVLGNDQGDGLNIINVEESPSPSGIQLSEFTENGRDKIRVVATPGFTGIKTLLYEVEDMQDTDGEGRVILYIYDPTEDFSILPPKILNYEVSGELHISQSEAISDVGTYTVDRAEYVGSSAQGLFNSFATRRDHNITFFDLTLNQNKYGVVWFRVDITGVPDPRRRNETDYSGYVFVHIERPLDEPPVLDEDNDSQFNNCPFNGFNEQGVGANSCCYPRPYRVGEYPADGSGFGSAGICRNTYIEATFNKEIETLSLDDNIIIARGTTGNCTAREQDVSSYVHLAYLDTETGKIERGFFGKVWDSIRGFFARIFRGDVFASDLGENTEIQAIRTWCATDIKVRTTNIVDTEDDGTVTSTVGIYIDKLLDSNTIYAVILKGATRGVKDVSGVGIRTPDGVFDGGNLAEPYARNDTFVFKTNNEICRIDHITVNPKFHVFRAPFTTTTFDADVHSTNGQRIVPTPQYNWAWDWKPSNHAVFEIPVDGTQDNLETVILGSKSSEGSVEGVAEAEITADETGSGDLGEVFTDTFTLHSRFCERLWPAEGVYPFMDATYNFSMGYCADAGRAGITADDLPYLNVPNVLTNTSEVGLALKKYLFFNPTTEDVIGLQIFANGTLTDPNNYPKSIREWYAERFGNVGIMKAESVAGYEALSDGNNLYINIPNVLNDRNTIYKNVLLLSINPNAQESTKEVFRKLRDSMQFTINLTDYGYCMEDAHANVRNVLDARLYNETLACGTDFDCLDAQGLHKVGTSGVCSNEKTKLFRDLVRIPQIQTAQININRYFNENRNRFDFAGDLESGTYIPGYTNTHWPSWGDQFMRIFGVSLTDPLNVWTACDGADDPYTCWSTASSTFVCPQAKSLYEYEYASSTQSYTLHGNLEYFTTSDSYVRQMIDTTKFTTEPWCRGTSVSVAYGVCGDGILNPGEECEPRGKQEIGQFGCAANQTKTRTCGQTCTWQYSASCTSAVVCGNGRVEGNEACDDGNNNGKYGYCNTSCSGLGEYCGDGQLQSRYEVCEKEMAQWKLGYCSTNVGRDCVSTSDCPVAPPLDFGPCNAIGGGTGACNRDTDISCSSNDDCLRPGLVSCVSGNESSYHLQKEKSCAWDCKSNGRYCGDGIVDTDFGEQCDDGNTFNTDACNNTCRNVVTDSQNLCGNNVVNTGEQCDDGNRADDDGCSSSCQNEVQGTYCGDERVQNPNSRGEAEQCDFGTNNGRECTPEYGNRCTFCTVDCRTQYKESTQRCGNGVVDFVDANRNGTHEASEQWLEQCDYQINAQNVQTKVFTTTTPNNPGVQCSTYISVPSAWSSVNEIRGSVSCENSCQTVNKEKCVQCGLKSIVDGGVTPKVAILNVMTGSTYDSTWANPMWKGIYGGNDVVPLYQRYMASSNLNLGRNYLQQQEIGSASNGEFYKSGERKNGIETNLLCKDFYSIYFNKSLIIGQIGGVQPDMTRYGTYFPYPVNGETNTVNRELVISPAVPEGYIRVVVRWQRKDVNDTNMFAGNLFVPEWHQSTQDYGPNFAYMNQGKYPVGAPEFLCNDISIENYADMNSFWRPVERSPEGNLCGARHISAWGLYQHPAAVLPNGYSGAQATTVDLTQLYSEVHDAFVVTSLNNLPMQQMALQGYDVWVELYVYRMNGLGPLSIFKPYESYTTHLRDVEKSDNPGAPYWHVFNIKRRGTTMNYDIDVVNSIETNECQINQNIDGMQDCTM